jgi:hypothetical protein
MKTPPPAAATKLPSKTIHFGIHSEHNSFVSATFDLLTSYITMAPSNRVTFTRYNPLAENLVALLKKAPFLVIEETVDGFVHLNAEHHRSPTFASTGEIGKDKLCLDRIHLIKRIHIILAALWQIYIVRDLHKVRFGKVSIFIIVCCTWQCIVPRNDRTIVIRCSS